MFFVKVKVAATEYGVLLAALDAALLLALRRIPGTKAARLMGTLGGILMCLPVVRAGIFSRGLRRQLGDAFGPVPDEVDGPGGVPNVALNAGSFPWRWLARPAPGGETVAFDGPEGSPLEFDLYRPGAARPGFGAEGAPAVVIVHGGRWTEGDSKDFAALNPYLAARGYAVVSTNYRKAGRHPFPAALDDVEAAVGHVLRHGRHLGIDPRRVALLGRSAGGQLALLAAYRNTYDVRGVASYYGPTDLRFGYYQATNPRVIDNVRTLETYLRANPSDDPLVYDEASPVNLVSPQSPPTLLVHGALDEVVHPGHGDRLAARLQAADVPHLYLRLPWATHGFDHNLRGPSGMVSTYALECFLGSVLR